MGNVVDAPDFSPGDRVVVKPLGMEATVVRQIMCYDGGESHWGNVELMYDDGCKGVSHSWQVKNLHQEA